jgi:hypothetical protein
VVRKKGKASFTVPDPRRLEVAPVELVNDDYPQENIAIYSGLSSGRIMAIYL